MLVFLHPPIMYVFPNLVIMIKVVPVVLKVPMVYTMTMINIIIITKINIVAIKDTMILFMDM